MNELDIITLTCPACGKQVKVKSVLRGRQVRCPNEGCGNPIDVPKLQKSRVVADSGLMYLVGGVFVLIAGLLTVKETELGPGWIVSLLLLTLAVVSEFLRGFAKGGTLALFAVVGLSTPLLFFLLQRDMPFYVGTVVFFGLSTYLVCRTRMIWSRFDLKVGAKHAINLESVAAWFALVVSALAVSWSTYFRFLATLQDEHIERRLAFTLFLIVVGVVCSVFGRKSPLPFLGLMGLTFMMAGVAKALAYDTTHLTGFLRIGVFAGGGAVLLLGGALMKKQARSTV